MDKAFVRLLLALLLHAATSVAFAEAPLSAAGRDSGKWLESATIAASQPAKCVGCQSGLCARHNSGLCARHNKVPFARLSIDVLWLGRSDADSQDVLFDSGGAPVFNVSELDLGVEAGPQINAVLFHEEGYDVGIRYFGISDYLDREERTSPGGNFLFFGSSLLTPVDTYTVEYRSELFNGELNNRWRVNDKLAVLFGARTTHLQEVFNILTGPNSGVFSTADNDLYGVQVGGEGVWWTNGYVRFESSAKVGVFYNDVDVFAEASDAAGASLTLNANDDATAFLGEFMAGFVIPIWPGELRIGYQGLWLDNIILAPDQSDSLSFFVPGSVDFGDVMYHGGYAGWQATW